MRLFKLFGEIVGSYVGGITARGSRFGMPFLLAQCRLWNSTATIPPMCIEYGRNANTFLEHCRSAGVGHKSCIDSRL